MPSLSDSATSGSPPSAGQLIVVLGMHRSGTSALGGALHSLGVWMGRRLMPPKENDNERGFFEHEDVVALNDRILRACGVLWNVSARMPEQWWLSEQMAAFRTQIWELLAEEFAGHALSAIKDPRMCRTLPLWQQVWREMNFAVHYVHMLRHPAEVSRSLQRRDAMSIDSALALWRLHVAEAAHYSGDGVVCTYDQLLQVPERVLGGMAQQLGVQWPAGVTTSVVNEFVTAGLRHHRENSAPTTVESRLYCRINEAASSADAWADLAAWTASEMTREWSGQLSALHFGAACLGQQLNEIQTLYSVTDAALGEAQTLCVERLSMWQQTDAELGKAHQIVDEQLRELHVVYRHITEQSRHLLQAVSEREHLQAALDDLTPALAQAVSERELLDKALGETQQILRERDASLVSLNQTATTLDKALTDAQRFVREREADIQHLHREASEYQLQIDEMQRQIEEMLHRYETQRSYLAAVYRFSWMRIKDRIRSLLRN